MNPVGQLNAHRWFVTVATIAVTGIAAVAVVKPVRWRVHLLGLYAAGRIPDVDFQHLVRYIAPRSNQQLLPLIEAKNPFEVIRNPETSQADVRAGGELFLGRDCAHCHGSDGSGGSGGPALNRSEWKHGASDWAVYRTVRYGVPGTAMPAHDLPDEAVWRLVAFVRFLGGNRAAPPKDTANIDVRVASHEIADVRLTGDDWLTYAGSYSGWRHSRLQSINPSNVGQLGLRWIHPLESKADFFEATPLVRHATMFLTVSSTRVLALDARTGREIWHHDIQLPTDVAVPDVGTTIPNRGVALLDDKVFVASFDARLIALSAATGAVVWDKKLATDAAVYRQTSAPLAVGDLIVTGVGSKVRGRGFIVALDKETGRERWRFTAVPDSGETGSETWKGDSWRDGGGSPWLTGSYDPQEDLLIWGIGNPKPDYDRAKRRGDNLYTNSVVALRGKTGKLVWHFQFTPGDDHDWDSAQTPLLVDDSSGMRKQILWANRNGFYYVLDRLTGRFITGAPFVQQNWASGLDSVGRPILVSDSARKRAGLLVYPGNVGGTNWWAPSFDPKLNLVFVPVLEQGMVFFSSTSSWPQPDGGRPFYTAVRALDATTGACKWEFRHDPRLDVNRTGGVMTTSSGVLFGGDNTTFFALDSRTGRDLWSVETGGTIHAPPVTYTVDGEQFVSIVAGKNLMTFALPRSQPRSSRKRVDATLEALRP